jgi:hypothetical protein
MGFYDSLMRFVLGQFDRAGDALLASPPPSGWLPQGPDGELLLMLLPDEEVCAASKGISPQVPHGYLP